MEELMQTAHGNGGIPWEVSVEREANPARGLFTKNG